MTDRRDDADAAERPAPDQEAAPAAAPPSGAEGAQRPAAAEGAPPGPVGDAARVAPTEAEDAAPGPEGAASEPVQLDDVMLAMDVVDTLRHREHLIARELAAGARDEDMVARLRQIYAAQGIDVPDRILQEGVEALKENRFVYTPKGSPGARRWALLWVRRGRVAAAALGLVLLVAAAVYGYDAAVRAPRRALAGDLASTRAAIVALSEVPQATSEANELYRQAELALGRGDQGEAREVLDAMRALRARLEQAYTLRIVTNPETGVWRVPDVNTQARNYYLIVEAIGPNGQRVRVPVTSEETGMVREVSTWGMRVDEETFERVRRDKLDDGIVQDATFGVKRAGTLEPEYAYPTTGGAITEW
ncbi:MAG TPA: DUF6384 family protein [Trueperaceae bacterium]|nr:DUF6384 family protein [Trueperaceae bacterium]